MLDNILDNIDATKLVKTERIKTGIKYNCMMNLTGPNDYTYPVKTTWILCPKTDTYQLVTEIVQKEV